MIAQRFKLMTSYTGIELGISYIKELTNNFILLRVLNITVYKNNLKF